jgi:hypothetical protein
MMKRVKKKSCTDSCCSIIPDINPKPKVEPPEWWDNTDEIDEED